MNEQKIEQEIQDKGLNAPRLTPDHIDSVIIGETYTNLPDGRTVICQLTLKNGYTIDGKSACVSKSNFDQEIGNKIARQNAREKIWELEGYLLKEKLRQVGVTPKDRLIIEQRELFEKLDKLETFLDKGQPDFINDEQWKLLQEQHLHMDAYNDVLTRRIISFQ